MMIMIMAKPFRRRVAFLVGGWVGQRHHSFYAGRRKGPGSRSVRQKQDKTYQPRVKIDDTPHVAIPVEKPCERCLAFPAFFPAMEYMKGQESTGREGGADVHERIGCKTGRGRMCCNLY